MSIHDQSLFREYVQLLARWAPVTNLVSRSEIGAFWSRHIENCASLTQMAPNALRWLDVGSGAGLPGIVVSIQLANAGAAGACVHLVESDTRKCVFLREIGRK